MSEEENKAVIRRWIEAFNERDLEAEADLLAPGYVAHVPDAPTPLDLQGLQAWRGFTAPFVEALPDLRLTIEDIAAEGDTVAARVAFGGTHRGEFQGIPDRQASRLLEHGVQPRCGRPGAGALGRD